MSMTKPDSSQVGHVPSGGLSATNVQSALVELDTEKANLASPTFTATDKATPVDADSVLIADSAAAGILKKLTWANLKTAIKTYLSGVAFPIGSTTPSTVAATTVSASNYATAPFIAASAGLGSFPVAQGLYGYYSGGGVLGAYSNNAGAYGLLTLDGSQVLLRAGGVGIAAVSSTGLAVTGALSATGALNLGVAASVEAVVNSADSLHFNIDSNADDPANANYFVWGRDRAVATGGTELMRLDASGNLGLGVTPSAWFGSYKALQVSANASIYTNTDFLSVSNNSYTNTSAQDIYRATGYATKYTTTTSGGVHTWHTAPSGTAGNPITFTQAMTLDASGNLLVGVASITAGQSRFQVSDTLAMKQADSATFSSSNAANACVRVGSMLTGRSINAHGTINASGADYAEYERNNGLAISKGSIVGFKADGTLTTSFTEAFRFAIKSTNPSYVGGDTWGTEDKVGKRPDEPQRIADKTEQVEVTPAVAAVYDGEGIVYPAVEAVYETYITEPGDTDAEWTAKQAAYAADLAAFEARLEAARQQVDRIAYSGKVPCNVLGATPGGYIVASELDDHIVGLFVADPDFAQYKKAVGRVNRILEDGRCEVAVIIH